MDNTKVVLGVSKTAIREKDDFYATDPKAIDLLLKMGG